MRKIRQHIESIMISDKTVPKNIFGMAMSGISLLYGCVMKFRESLYKKGIFTIKRLPCKVISVGNITVGGTGKTPMTIYLANLLDRHRYKVAVVSRGYKGHAEKNGGIVSDGENMLMGPDAAGDEPFMMAKCLKHIPVVVGQNRYTSGMKAITHFKPDVIVLDDAFQHLKLARDIDLMLLDALRPFGNNRLLPAGILREPISALNRSDAYILTRSDSGDSAAVKTLKKIAPTMPVFISSHVPYVVNTDKKLNAEFLKGQRAFAFSGIAKNTEFRSMIQRMGVELSGFLEFPDHHRYSAHDFRSIFESARNANANTLITTEKDYARMAYKMTCPLDLAVIGISISFGNNNTFDSFILNRLTEIK